VTVSKRIRVLHCVGSLEVGGEERYVARITSRMDPARFEQIVAYAHGDRIRGEFAPGVELVEVLGHRPRASRVRDWALLPEFYALIRRQRVDVVATQSPGIWQIAASMAAKACRLPVVHTIQRAYGLRSRTEDHIIRSGLLRRALYAMVDRFVALSSYYLEDQATRWQIPRSKLWLNYMGVDLSEYCPDPEAGRGARAELGLPADAPVLGLVARHRSEKGLARAIAAFARVHDLLPAARLLLVGDGPTRKEHEADVAERGLRAAVMFAGARLDTARMMNACDAIVQATYNPLNGISSIEAMAAGRPIVTIVDNEDEAAMAHDTCVDDENGHLFRTDRSADCAAKLARLLADRDALGAMGAQSRRMATRFDIRRHVTALEEMYAALAKV
jgi:glycosyltransferase involved in cell wall biosynthesis